MPLQMSLSKRQMVVLNNLYYGTMEWEDLSFDDKLRAYKSGINLTDEVKPKKIQRFERELKMKQMTEGKNRVGSAIGRIIKAVTS